MKEGFHSARFGLLDSDLLLTSPFPLLLKLYFKGRRAKDFFFFNLSLKNSRFKKKKLICFSVWGLYPLMDFDLHKLFSPGPARIPDALELRAGSSLHNHPVVQTVCSRITAPNGGWGSLLEWSSHAWIPPSLPSISIPAAASCPQPMPDCHAAHCHSHPVGCRADFSTVCVKSNTFKSKKCPSLSNDRICFAFAATMKLLL